MTYFSLADRVMLVVVFGVAAVAKTKSRRAFAEFADSLTAMAWIPGAWRGALPIGVVMAETAVTTLLVVPATAGVGLCGACAVLSAFSGAIMLSLRRGEQVSCLCFGGDAGPMGRSHVARNLLLAAAAAAGFLVAPFDHATGSPQGVVAAIGGGAMLGFLVIRWAGPGVGEPERASGAAHKLPSVGAPIGAFQITALDGSLITDSEFGGAPRYVAFVMVGCGSCEIRINRLRSDSRFPSERTTLFVVSDDPDSAEARDLGDSVAGLGRVALVRHSDPVTAAFGGIAAYPTLLRTDSGRIAAAGWIWNEVAEPAPSPDAVPVTAVG